MSSNYLYEGVSLNRNAQERVDDLVAHADDYRIAVQRNEDGVTLIDAGIDVPGSMKIGARIAEICLGGLARVRISPTRFDEWPLGLSVMTCNPVLACLGSQYAGWSLSFKEGDKTFPVLGSGPARALACREALFKELNYRDQAECGVLMLEMDRHPPAELLRRIAKDCKIKPENLTVIVMPTQCMAGCAQIVARVLEVAMHKAHELGFALDDIIDGYGCAPLAPPTPDAIVAMGRTNDAILFAGYVHLFVQGGYDEARDLCHQLPSSTSRDYGVPFAEVFKAHDYDFFKVDPMLFSPAKMLVTHVPSGQTFSAGKIDLDLLRRSFGY